MFENKKKTTKNKPLFVYWIACWEIPEICSTEVNESNPFPLAMGDCAHVVKKKKGWAAHGFRGKLQYEGGRMTVKQTNTRRSVNPRIATGLQTLHLLQICGYSQEYQSHAESGGESSHVEKRSSESWQRGTFIRYWYSLCVKVDSVDFHKTTLYGVRVRLQLETNSRVLEDKANICFSIHFVCFSVTARV